MAKSLNKVQLIGNLTRDPELRYTPNGSAVCTFGMATNRTWTTDAGEKKEEADFHNIVAWRKLAELCSQYLTKGQKVYVEGRLSTRSWTGQDGQQKYMTEVVIDDMILLGNRNPGASVNPAASAPQSVDQPKQQKRTVASPVQDVSQADTKPSEEEVLPEDIPF